MRDASGNHEPRGSPVERVSGRRTGCTNPTNGLVNYSTYPTRRPASFPVTSQGTETLVWGVPASSETREIASEGDGEKARKGTKERKSRRNREREYGSVGLPVNLVFLLTRFPNLTCAYGNNIIAPVVKPDTPLNEAKNFH